jgi:hypothetical protein
MSKKFYTVAKYRIGGGLKCDNPNCSWKDVWIATCDYHTWVDVPCPHCGENTVMPKKMFDTILEITKRIHNINVWFNKWVPEFILKRLEVDEK